MPVVNATKMWSRREAERSNTDGTVVEQGWQILTDDTEDDAIQVLEGAVAHGFPKVGDPHPGTAQLRVRSVDVKPRGPQFWEGRARYFVPTFDEQDPNPLDLPPTFEWRKAQSIEPTEHDADGAPVTNTVDEPFEPMLTRELNDIILTITRNIATFPIATFVDLIDSVNSATYLVPAGQAKINDISGRSVVDGNLQYWAARVEIQFRRVLPAPDDQAAKAWYRRVLNVGTRELAGTQPILDDDGNPTAAVTRKYRPILGEDGQRISTPVPLDANGKRLADGADPHWLTFRWYPSKSWVALNLPLPP